MESPISDVWDFKRDPKGRWHWQKQSLHHEVIQQGQRSFKEFDDCLADAQRCGYTGSLSVSPPSPRRPCGHLLGPKRS